MAFSGLIIAQTRWGQGVDIRYFPKQNLRPFSKIQYASEPIYSMAILTFKLSMLASYLRFMDFNRRYRLWIYAVGVFVTINHVGFVIGFIFGCDPVRSFSYPPASWNEMSRSLVARLLSDGTRADPESVSVS